MGAHPTDYARSAPYRSYIHVDEFESPKELAGYLHRLDRDDELYNSYFRWKGTGEFINTYFWCRVCAMLHDNRPPKFYKDVNEWWRGDSVCTTTSWREHDLVRAGNSRNTWSVPRENRSTRASEFIYAFVGGLSLHRGWLPREREAFCRYE